MDHATVNNRMVLVTGGSGFVGLWTIATLLQRGYAVRAIIRDSRNGQEVREAIETHTENGHRLSIVSGDLISDERWKAALRDCDSVIHLACVATGTKVHPQEVVRTEQTMTCNVVASALHANVRRVVIISPLEAMARAGDQAPATNVEADWWTNLIFRRVDGHIRAKLRAERTAWELMNQRSWSATTLTSVLPGAVIGAGLSLKLGCDYRGSTEMIGRMMRGSLSRIPRIGFHLVDVRDLADVLVRAMESDHAAGQRFVATSGYLWASEIASIMRDNLGRLSRNVPTKECPHLIAWFQAFAHRDTTFFGRPIKQYIDIIPTKAMQMLGWCPRPLSDSVIDAALMH